MRVRRTHPIHCIAAAALIVLGARVAWPQEQPLTAAYNASGQDLFWHFSSTSRDNIVFSPYSIGAAMAMALSGARGETETQMAAALKHTLLRAEMEDANAQVQAKLNGYGVSKPFCAAGMVAEGQLCKGPRRAGGGCAFPARLDGEQCVEAVRVPPSAKLAVANALMLVKAGEAVLPDYLSLLREKYGAEVFRNVQLDDVNNWVDRKTEKKISKILEKLDPDTAAILLNAVYFKASWRSPFEKQATIDETFNLTPGETAKVPTMRRVGSYAVVKQAGFRAIRMPYAVTSLGMVIVLPEKIDGLREVTAQLDARELGRLLAALRGAPAKAVDLALPRFKANFTADLISPFAQVGMRLPFDPTGADFSGITGKAAAQGGLYISAITHRAVIEVDEEGAEAAAATLIGMQPAAAPLQPPPPPEPFRVDRPFLFYLVDNATGAILFQGRIMDPRS
jgi:serpin B